MSGLSFKVSLSVEENGRKAPEYTLDTDLNGEITLAALLDFTKSSLIIIADQTLKEEQALGFDKKPVIAVDGKVGKPVIDVSPLGKIEMFARSDMNDIILDTYKALLERSPVLTGRYKDSHYVFFNGSQVATNLSGLETWLASKPVFQEKDRIRFVNIQPYARKLERHGITGNTTPGGNYYSNRSERYTKGRDRRNPGGKVLAPNGAYFLAARSVSRRFKNRASIKFYFTSGANIGLTATFKTSSPGRKSKKPRTYLYPSIVISVSESGIL
jgi:hypothetical protein